MYNKEILDIMEEVNKIINSTDGAEKLHKLLVNHAYENVFSDKSREIYEESLNIFDKKDCDSTVMSILTMGYDDNYVTDTVSKVLDCHSELYEPFIIDRPMIWTISKVLEIDINLVEKECKEWENNRKDKLKSLIGGLDI